MSWWLVAGGWWLVAGGWWLVAGGWWLVAGGWWLVRSIRPGGRTERTSKKIAYNRKKSIDLFAVSKKSRTFVV